MKVSSKCLFAILTIVLGVLFLVLKAQVVGITMTVLGVVLIVAAVLDLLQKQYVPCAVKAVIGVLIIVFGWTLTSIALYVMSAILLIYGILQLYEAIKANKRGKNLWKTILLYAQPVAIVVAAIFLLVNQGGAISWAFIVAGIFLIVEGAIGLINCLKAKK